MLAYAFAGLISAPVIVGGVCVYKYYKYKADHDGYGNATMIDILFY